MYFIDDKHEAIFSNLLSYYDEKGNDPQYRANIYIASIPEIFKLTERNQYYQGEAPLLLLSKYSEEKNKLIAYHEGLTGSTRKLVEIGLSLLNGNEVSLDFTYGEETSQAVLQAMKIRYLGE